MKPFLIFIALAVVGAAGWYFISPFFNTVEIDDALPVAFEETMMLSGAEELTPEEKAAFDAAMTEANQSEAGGEPMAEPRPNSQPSLSQVAEVMPTVGHPAEGTVRVLQTADGPVIRYENFSTLNGPQLHLYLAKDLDAEEFIDLGPIRGTKGNINYQVPAGVDLSEYRYVMHWCVPFGVLFNYADIGSE